jgi:hypothetical protein
MTLQPVLTMLRPLDGCDLVAEIHRLRPLGRLSAAGEQFHRCQSRNISCLRSGSRVNRNGSSSGNQLGIRAEAGSGNTVASPGSPPADRRLDRGRSHQPTRRRLRPAPIHSSCAHPCDQDSRTDSRELLRDRWRSETPTVAAAHRRQVPAPPHGNSCARECTRPATVGQAIELS